MITRIVRMTFDPEKTEAFLEIFQDAKHKIRAMPGCHYLSLHRDYHQPNVFYTLSKWESQKDLDAYRKSKVFESTWSSTKLLFADKPTAHSLIEEIELI